MNKFVTANNANNNSQLYYCNHDYRYRPHISVEYLARMLAFANVDKCVEWLITLEGIKYVGSGGGQLAVPTPESLIDCKESVAAVATL